MGRGESTFEDCADFFEGEETAELAGLGFVTQAAEPAAVNSGADGGLHSARPLLVVPVRLVSATTPHAETFLRSLR